MKSFSLVSLWQRIQNKIAGSLQTKLLISFISMGVFAIAGVGIFSFIIAKDTILSSTFQELTAAREAKKTTIEKFINNKLDGAELCASSIALERIMNELKEDPYLEIPDRAVNIFLKTGDYHSLTIIFDTAHYAFAPVQKCVRFTDSVPHYMENHFKKIYHSVSRSQKRTVFDFINENGYQVLSVSSPVFYKNGRFHAVAVLTIPLKYIDNIMLQQTSFGGMGATGETYLVGDDHIMRSTSRFDSLSAMKTLVSSTAVTDALSGNKSTRITKDYRGVRVLSSYTPLNIPGLNWVMLSEIDEREIMVPVQHIRNEVILVSSTVLALLLLVLIWTSKRLANPLKQLRSLAITIAGGDYGKTIPYTTTDEVGQLAEALNTMSVEILNQRDELKDKNKEILDSIAYAKRIQTGMLPSQRFIENLLNDSFVLYIPKHTVSGDFYYLGSEQDQIIMAVGDCTGHGVPGAFVSGICLGALQRSVKGFGRTKPSEILDKLNEIVLEMFSHSEMDIHDGMDISLCSIDLKGKTLQYSGANNSLYLLRNGDFQEIKADRQPIGRYFEKKPFTNHEIQMQEGDCIYMFSDGYIDQFGGPAGKKFMRSRLRELLIDIHQKPMVIQKLLLEEALHKWKGDKDLIDDICVFGTRL